MKTREINDFPRREMSVCEYDPACEARLRETREVVPGPRLEGRSSVITLVAGVLHDRGRGDGGYDGSQPYLDRGGGPPETPDRRRAPQQLYRALGGARGPSGQSDPGDPDRQCARLGATARPAPAARAVPW